PVQAKTDTTPALVVNGSSEVRVKPDLATLQAGITVQAKTARDAQDQANRRISAFLESAKKLLGSKGTVQTGALNLSPVYSEQMRSGDQPFTPQITAYRADDTISIRTTDFSLVGPVIDTAVAAGLN